MTLILEPVEEIEIDPSPSIVGVMARILIAPAVGVVLAALLLFYVLLPTIGLGSVERIAALGKHLEHRIAHRPTAVFLGNSITREGIDARLVEAAASGGWHAENGAENAETQRPRAGDVSTPRLHAQVGATP